MDAGLRTLPGTAAEILDDEVRADPVPRQDQHRGVARGAPHRPLASGCARTSRSCSARSSSPRSWARHLVAHPRPAEGDRRVHRVRAAAVRAHGRADLPAAQGAPRPDVPRGRAHARRRPHRLPRPHRQHPGVVGEARRRRRAPAAAGGRQRPRRHAHGREHLARRGRIARSGAWTRPTSARSSSRSAARSSSAPRSTAGSSPSADRLSGSPPRFVELRLDRADVLAHALRAREHPAPRLRSTSTSRAGSRRHRRRRRRRRRRT